MRVNYEIVIHGEARYGSAGHQLSCCLLVKVVGKHARLKSSVEVVAVLQRVLDVRQRLQHVRMFWPRNKQNTGVISLSRRLLCFETCLKFYTDIFNERLAELLTESNKLNFHFTSKLKVDNV